MGHGYIRPEDHQAVMDMVVEALERDGGAVDGVYACIHKRGSGCYETKPRPGMLTDAARDLDLDLSRSFMVGDNRKDMQAGNAAGTRTVLVDPRFRTWWQRARRFADHVARDLPEATDWILQQQARQARAVPSA